MKRTAAVIKTIEWVKNTDVSSRVKEDELGRTRDSNSFMFVWQ